MRTGRKGAVAKAGHDLLIHVIGWNATLVVSDESTLVLDVDSTSFRVREGTGGMQELTDDDKANIEQTINDEVLLGKNINFRSNSVEVTDRRLGIEGDLTLMGQTHPIALENGCDIGCRQPRKPQHRTPRSHGRQEGVRPRGDQHEHRRRGRLFQRFEQRVLSGGLHRLGLVDDRDAAPAFKRPVDRVLDDVAHLLHFDRSSVARDDQVDIRVNPANNPSACRAGSTRIDSDI